MDGHCLTYFNHLTVRTPRMYANRAEAPHSTHDPSRQRAEDWKFFLVCRSTDQPHTAMVFTFKTISSDCIFYLPGFFFFFVSLLLFFVPAHHNHFTTIIFYSESFTLRLLHRRTRFRIGGSIGSQRPRGQILERFGRIFLFFSL